MVTFIPLDQLHSFLRIFLFGHSWQLKGNMERQHAPCRFHLTTARLAMLFIGLGIYETTSDTNIILKVSSL